MSLTLCVVHIYAREYGRIVGCIYDNSFCFTYCEE